MKKNKVRKLLAARNLRKNMTKTERMLWKYLSNRGMCNIKFRRQYIFKGFILDFYCPSKKIGIEIDGKIHDFQKDYDKARQEIIEMNGIKVLRFTNNEVIKDIESVLRAIKRKLIPSLRSGEGCPELARDGVRT